MTGNSASSRTSLRMNSTVTATATPTQALRVNVKRDGHGERGHDDRGPGAMTRIEQQAADGGADDQHQQTRVGHVVAHRALRPLSEVVVVESPYWTMPRMALAAPTVMMTL